MNRGLLPAEEWRLVQRSVPVACVDVVVWRWHPTSEDRELGLILRDTPHEGRRWCLVGGRLLLDERLVDAVRRQVFSTLATEPVEVSQQPLHVAEYSRDSTGGPHDPRQHAIGMTWAVQVHGTPAPRGEARNFRWFPQAGLPELGFGQQSVVANVMGALQPAGAEAPDGVGEPLA